MQFQVNDSKNVTIQVGDRYFARNAIQTHFVQIGENYIDLVKRYVAPLYQEGVHSITFTKLFFAKNWILNGPLIFNSFAIILLTFLMRRAVSKYRTKKERMGHTLHFNK